VLLTKTPTVLRELCRDLPAQLSNRSEGHEAWSPVEVLGHLIDGENVDWIPRLRMILATGESIAFTPFDREGFRKFIQEKSLDTLLAEFQRARTKNLEALRDCNLTNEDLQRTGMHPELGRVTVQQLLAAWVVHDLGHIRQIVRSVARQFHDEVGPWEEYLSILTEK